MSNDELESELRRIVRWSQVNAVVRAIRHGRRPRVGEVLDHTLEFPDHHPNARSARDWAHSRRHDVYQFEVEPWQLEEADRLASGSGSASHGINPNPPYR